MLLVAGLAVGGLIAWRAWTAWTAPLPGVIVVEDEPPPVPGYERGCGAGQACVYGPAWSDDVSVRLGHNGCDTRNDMLNQSLTNITHRPNTHDCVVLSGDFVDPYTGNRIHFEKSRAYQVQVDHVFALAVAWNRGAAGWTPDQRRNFANDPDNLVVTSAAANLSKGGRTPAAWLPEPTSGKCLLTSRFTAIAAKYQLPITREELIAVNRVAPRCAD